MAIAESIRNALPMGAEITAAGTRFRVWAPERNTVQLLLVDRGGHELTRHHLDREPNGFFSTSIQGARHGTLYYFQLDDDSKKYPDPASRFQPQGVHGPSQVIDAGRFQWRDKNWLGVRLRGQVLYELHIGTFTPEGTWKSASEKLPYLRDIGISLVEVMPVAAFPGKFGWGYDGVSWFAPTELYGEPDDFRGFVNEAHQLGIGVILDVVYNHFGPAGNYAPAYSPYFLSKKHHTEWGDAINFDGAACEPVREFIAANAAYWIREFHLDGLRLDAVHSIVDDSDEHIVTLLARTARAAGGKRSILIFGENERQQTQYVMRPEDGGYGIDALWNDDFHHACRVAATGHAEAYYRDYRGSPQEIISTIRLNYLYQGQWNARQAKCRGTPSRGIPAPHFVHFLQNHDQVANSTRGLRTHLLTSPGRNRALTALLLLGPQTPMLFMGQEFGASSPFLYFADHEPELAAMVRRGRHEFMGQFPRVTGFDSVSPLPDPAVPNTFEVSKLDWNEGQRNVELIDLHRDLIGLRKEDAVFSRQDQRMIEASVAGPEAFILRWFDETGDDRLGFFNLGRDLEFFGVSEPLLAPPPDCSWSLLWSSEDPRYGGTGTPPFDEKAWRIPGPAAVMFRATPTEI
jgi:maltooligosyltrehalose trehalohydrolase